MQAERRAHPRRAVVRPAIVKLAQGREVPCTLRNISCTGAMIALESAFTLPRLFVLDLSGNILVQRPCELVWQRERVAGVKFPALKGFQSIQFDLY